MARKTKEEAQETRHRILEAATRIFHEKGVGSSSLEDVAAAAGMTRGAIYWHFKNKHDLFSALHQEVHSFFMEQIIAKQEISSDQPLHQLAELAIETLSIINTDKQRRMALGIFTLKCEYAGEMERLLAEQNKNKAEALAMVAGFFKKAAEKKQIPPDSDCDLLALSLFCYISGILSENLRNPGLFNLEKQARPLVMLFFDRIKA